MKKIFWLTVFLALIFSACTPQAEPTRQPVFPVEDSNAGPKPTRTPAPVKLTSAQAAAFAALAEIAGLPTDKIKLISTEAVTWSDGCLGVQRMGVMCTQALVEGYRIVLEADGKQYEFHTDQDGSAVVLAVDDASDLLEDALVAQLAENLGLDNKQVSVASNEAVEFGDACLGVSMPEIMCAQVLTPGRTIVLEANGVQYEYHVSADGSHIQPATLALTWKREGGIAGFCDNMTVFLSGEVYTATCKGDGKMGTFATLLSKPERDQFAAWAKEFGQAELDASDPEGVADRMVVTLSFNGKGSGNLLPADEEALFQWAQALYRKASQ